MKAKQTYYDRVSQVRILRGIIASLLMCIAVLLFAVFQTGNQLESLRADMAAVAAEGHLLSE